MNLQAIYDYFTRYITCSSTLALLKQYLQVSVESGGEFFTPRGLCRGSALSPIIGAGLLFELYARMDALPGVFYVRYMDDMLIVAASRWSMRRARRTLLEMMDNMGFTMHPDKTQVGVCLIRRSTGWGGYLSMVGLRLHRARWQILKIIIVSGEYSCGAGASIRNKGVWHCEFMRTAGVAG